MTSTGARHARFPHHRSNVDCNGWSEAYAPARPQMRALCTNPIAINRQGKASRLTDNGWYVGHDEPSVKFISSQPGSGNTMTLCRPAGLPDMHRRC